jgi:gluconate 2-dehydrogenase gamma chain
MTFISRRDLLKRVAAAPVAGVLQPAAAIAVNRRGSAPMAADRAADESAGIAGTDQGKEPLESLTASEMELLDAIVARLIPADANGPGAKEARVARYIDRALGGALARSRSAYTSGLAALDRYARSSRGAPFAQLMAADQDAVLREVESGAAAGFAGGSTPFFSMLLAHTHQGMFGDPYYGGNADFIGWGLLGYPGVRTMVSASDQQRLEANELKPNRKSAYDYETFTKA